MGKFDLNRRQFLGALSLGTAHILFSNPLYAAASRFTTPDPLQRIALGKSGLETTLLGVGTGVSGGNRSSFLTRQDKNKSIAVLRHAYDRGFRQYDLADTYGTHPLMAEALKGMDREELLLGSKIWTRGGGIPENERPGMDVVVDRFREELDTDYIDLMQIHCMVDADWTTSMKKQMDELSDLKAKGIIKAHGVSVHSHDAMIAALKSPWVDVIHARINPYGIAMDKAGPGEVVELIQKLHNSGKGVIGMKLIGNGDLRDESKKIDHSLKFVLGLGSVDMMIIGFESVEQIDNIVDRVQTALVKL